MNYPGVVSVWANTWIRWEKAKRGCRWSYSRDKNSCLSAQRSSGSLSKCAPFSWHQCYWKTKHLHVKSCFMLICVCAHSCVWLKSCMRLYPVSRETTNTQPGQPAAAEPALLRHSLQLLQDGGEQASDKRAQDGPRHSCLPLSGVPDRGHPSYPYSCCQLYVMSKIAFIATMFRARCLLPSGYNLLSKPDHQKQQEDIKRFFS